MITSWGVIDIAEDMGIYGVVIRKAPNEQEGVSSRCQTLLNRGIGSSNRQLKFSKSRPQFLPVHFAPVQVPPTDKLQRLDLLTSPLCCAAAVLSLPYSPIFFYLYDFSPSGLHRVSNIS